MTDEVERAARVRAEDVRAEYVLRVKRDIARLLVDILEENELNQILALALKLPMSNPGQSGEVD